jgi:5-methylthioadenosine/S-adenosylhomocysteine deaminase
MDPTLGIIEAGDLLIDDGKIIAVGRNLGSWAVIEIDGRGMIAMPGFINGHIHLWQTALRGMAADWTLDRYFSVLIGQVVGLYTPQDAYIGNLVGALDQINSGVTTLFDWCHIVNTPAHADAAVDALREACIRAIFAYGTPMTLFGTKEPHPADAARMRKEAAILQRRTGDDGAGHSWHRLRAGYRRGGHQVCSRAWASGVISRRLRQAWTATAIDAELG